MKLYTSDNDNDYVVIDVPDYALLKTLGVFKGSKITKKDTYKFGGPVLIKVDDREVAIGKDIAVLIEVSEVSKNV